MDFESIEEDARAFLRSRSSAGQAARALVHLDDLSSMWAGGNVESLEVDVYLEEADADVGAFLEQRLKERTGVPQVSVTAASRYGPVTVSDEHFVTLLRAEDVHTLPAPLARLIEELEEQ